jgi:putative ABC transport system permease protein
MLSGSITYPRFWMRLFLIFAIVAVTLVVVGVFGVISGAVSERTHEIGVRMAIGAQKRDVFLLVIKQGLKVTLIGLAVGTAISLGLSGVLTSQIFLYEVDPMDPLTHALAALLLLGIALAACYFPARRATRVDPVVALKYE